jgi:hypothetical protein
MQIIAPTEVYLELKDDSVRLPALGIVQRLLHARRGTSTQKSTGICAREVDTETRFLDAHCLD